MGWLNNISPFYKRKDSRVSEQLNMTYAARNPYSWAVGRFNSVFTNMLLLRPDLGFRGTANPETAKGVEIQNLIAEAFKDMKLPGEQHVQMYFNHYPLLQELWRLIKGTSRVNPIFRGVFGIPYTLSAWLAAQSGLTPGVFNPYTNAAVSMGNDVAIAAHELGHAEDFGNSRWPGLRALAYGIPLVGAPYLEWQANRNAMLRAKPEHRPQMAQILEPAYGSYVGSALLPFGPALNSLLSPVTAIPSAMLSYCSIAAGHLHSWFRSNKNPQNNATLFTAQDEVREISPL